MPFLLTLELRLLFATKTLLHVNRDPQLQLSVTTLPKRSTRSGIRPESAESSQSPAKGTLTNLKRLTSSRQSHSQTKMTSSASLATKSRDPKRTSQIDNGTVPRNPATAPATPPELQFSQRTIVLS